MQWRRPDAPWELALGPNDKMAKRPTESGGKHNGHAEPFSFFLRFFGSGAVQTAPLPILWNNRDFGWNRH